MARGINARADVPVPTLRDGTDAVRLFNELSQVMDTHNGRRDGLRNMLAYNVVNPSETVLQTYAGMEFEEATEYGEPVGGRLPMESLSLGFRFRWHDLASRATWQFLADATRAQVDAIGNAAVEADNKLVFRGVMSALFNSAQRTNEEGSTVYPLYNGDAMVPPPYLDEEFAAPHNHYLTTGAATLESVDVDRLTDAISEHGYGVDAASGRLLIFASKQEADVIRSFKVASGDKFDFIASDLAPAYLTDQTLVGDKPPSALGGVPIIGSYGNAWASESSLIPKGYLLGVVSNGANSQYAPVGFRQHPTASLQGLKLIGGDSKDYPLTNSFYVRGFGTGVRLRGAAAVLQVTAGAYSAPTAFAGV